MTEYEKCLAGLPFNGGESPMTNMAANARRLMRAFNAVSYGDAAGKYAILKEMLGGIGENVWVDVDFHCEYGKHIFVGDNTIINQNCTFIDNNRITIGRNVLIASNVQIYTATHSVIPEERRSEGNGDSCITLARPVTIKDNAWIGGGAIILPGVTIGEGVTIGAGSVVTRDIPARCVAVGNPCRVIRNISPVKI